MSNPNPQNPPPAPNGDAIDAKMQALIKLRTQMEELHAHLEYLKLMLKLRGR